MSIDFSNGKPPAGNAVNARPDSSTPAPQRDSQTQATAKTSEVRGVAANQSTTDVQRLQASVVEVVSHQATAQRNAHYEALIRFHSGTADTRTANPASQQIHTELNKQLLAEIQQNKAPLLRIISTLPLKTDQQLDVRIQGSELQLQAIKPAPLAQQIARQILPLIAQQDSYARLLSSLIATSETVNDIKTAINAPTASKADTLPNNPALSHQPLANKLQATVDAMLQRLPQLDQLSSAAGLRSAIQNSGLFLEASLRKILSQMQTPSLSGDASKSARLIASGASTGASSSPQLKQLGQPIQSDLKALLSQIIRQLSLMQGQAENAVNRPSGIAGANPLQQSNPTATPANPITPQPLSNAQLSDAGRLPMGPAGQENLKANTPTTSTIQLGSSAADTLRATPVSSASPASPGALAAPSASAAQIPSTTQSQTSTTTPTTPNTNEPASKIASPSPQNISEQPKDAKSAQSSPATPAAATSKADTPLPLAAPSGPATQASSSHGKLAQAVANATPGQTSATAQLTDSETAPALAKANRATQQSSLIYTRPMPLPSSTQAPAFNPGNPSTAAIADTQLTQPTTVPLIAPPLPGQIPLQAQAITRTAAKSKDLADALVSILLKQSQQALSRLQMHQLSSLHHQTSSELGQNRIQNLLSFELPLWHGSELNLIQFRIEESLDKPDNGNENNDQQRQWVVNLSFEIEGIGPIYCQATLSGITVNVSFWAKEPHALRLAREHLQELKDNLNTMGVKVKNLQCFPGEPPAQKEGIRRHLIDIQT